MLVLSLKTNCTSLEMGSKSLAGAPDEPELDGKDDSSVFLWTERTIVVHGKRKTQSQRAQTSTRRGKIGENVKPCWSS